jgi:potassium efflux system protein
MKMTGLWSIIRETVQHHRLSALRVFCSCVLVIFLLSFATSYGQETGAAEDTIAAASLPFAVSEIPSEFSKLTNRLIEVSEALQPVEQITNNDLLVKEYISLLEASKEEIMTTLPSMTYQRLESLIRAWHNYGSKLDGLQKTLQSRISEIESIELELEDELLLWDKVAQVLKKSELPLELRQGADTAQAALNVTLVQTKERADSLLLMQTRQSHLSLLIHETVLVLKEEQKVFQSNYFVIDAHPIWIATDSVSQSQNVGEYLKSESLQSYSILKTYLQSNRGIAFLQLSFIIILIIGFIALSRLWPTHELNPDSRREIQAGYIIRHPFFSSLLISIIISIFFYTNRPLVLGDFFVALMMVSSLVLLPGLMTRKIRVALILLLALFLLNVLQDHLPYQSFANRWIIFIQSIAILGLLYIPYKMKSEFQLRPTGKRIFTGFIGVFGLLMIMAVVSNIIGSVKLADFLISSTIGTLTFSVIVVTIVIILNSMMVLLIKGKKAESIPLFEPLKHLIDRRIRPMINWGAFLLWLFAALIYFRILAPVQDLMGKIMNTEFFIASVAISIGAIITFFIIVFVTYVIVRFVKNVFKDEWVAQSNLPRGSAEAISMLIRYAIVAFGIYLALNAIGLEMNKFGFIAGALGVGIGFGLQNIVLNFIAGLIITFENPIYVGDIIEVDQHMGKVTEIGVRASKVLTYDGSEVIVPNGLLISNKVVNWTLTNQKRRLSISIKTSSDVDPEKVIEIVKRVAGRHTNSLDQPAPLVVFNGYESYGFDFTLFCWVDFSVSLSTKSEIALDAIKALAAEGITAPMPVQKIKIDYEEQKPTKV